jgi:hypothetical protein
VISVVVAGYRAGQRRRYTDYASVLPRTPQSIIVVLAAATHDLSTVQGKLRSPGLCNGKTRTKSGNDTVARMEQPDVLSQSACAQSVASGVPSSSSALSTSISTANPFLSGSRSFSGWIRRVQTCS